MTTAPVLSEARLYLAWDRYVCGRVPCAGYTAVYSGHTTGGLPLLDVDEDVAALVLAEGDPVSCECGALTLGHLGLCACGAPATDEVCLVNENGPWVKVCATCEASGAWAE